MQSAESLRDPTPTALRPAQRCNAEPPLDRFRTGDVTTKATICRGQPPSEAGTSKSQVHCGVYFRKTQTVMPDAGTKALVEKRCFTTLWWNPWKSRRARSQARARQACGRGHP